MRGVAAAAADVRDVAHDMAIEAIAQWRAANIGLSRRVAIADLVERVAALFAAGLIVGASSADDQPRCRACGCTDSEPCNTGSGPCGWAESDLCTVCDTQAALEAAEERERGGEA